MSKEIMISPEGLELANVYLEKGSIAEAADELNITKDRAIQLLNKSEVKRYIDNVFMDAGYRNRNKLYGLLDTIIDSKVQEAEETEMYTSKDLVDLITLMHKMRMDEAKLEQTKESTSIKNQTNVQINDAGAFGQGNYGKLMEKLLGPRDIQEEG